MKKGDIVLYTDRFDADASETPNVSPAIVIQANSDDTLDLCVLFGNGMFFKAQAKMGTPEDRGCWHCKE